MPMNKVFIEESTTQLTGNWAPLSKTYFTNCFEIMTAYGSIRFLFSFYDVSEKYYA